MNFDFKFLKNYKGKSAAALAIFCAAVLIAGVLSGILIFKKSNVKSKKQNGTYKMVLDLTDNVLTGELGYSENAELSEQKDYFVFCLQPNFLFEGDLSGSSEQKNAENPDNQEKENGKNYKNEKNDETVENVAHEKLPLKVLSAGGKKFSYLNGGNYVKVKTETKNGVKSASISFKVDIPSGKNRLSATKSGINLANFYPYKCTYDFASHDFVTFDKVYFGDPFFNEFADYFVELKVPSEYTVAGATAASCEVGGEKTTYKYNLKNYTCTAFCLSKNFEVICKKWGNRSINCYFVKGDGRNAAEKESANFYEKTVKLAISALEFFSKNYGDYPRESYSIAFVPFFCGGMEYPALSLVSCDENVENSTKAVVHETAHQWFPLTAANNEYCEGYFDEGLAEFMTYKYFLSVNGDFAAEMLTSASKTVKNYTHNVCKDMKMNKRLCDFSSDYEYYATVYARGLILFYECEKLSGEKNFAAKIKSFYGSNKFSNVTASTFANMLKTKPKKAFFSIVESNALLCLPNK